MAPPKRMHTAIFPGRYVQAENALASLGDELSKFGKRSLIVAGGTAADSIVPAHSSAWGNIVVDRFGGECSDSEIDRLATIAKEKACDVVVGMGGGKVIDTAKAVGHSAGSRTAIVPTIASTDAPTSAVSVIYTESGEFERYLFLPRNPDLVLVDEQTIATAPERFLVAGIGDALATWFEADSCRRAHAENQCGGVGTLAAYTIARLCYDTILEYGVSAKTACASNVVTPALSHVIEANTLLSGLGFESAGLAAAHSIHNGLTRLEPTHDYYHGEKVTIGVLAGLFLTDRSAKTINEVYGFCEALGLPTTIAAIGLKDLSDEDFGLVGEGACADGETIHHEACPISPRAVVAALKAADRFGRQRQS